MQIRLYLIPFIIFFPLFGFASENEFPDPNMNYRPGIDRGILKYSADSLKNQRKVVLTFDDGPDPVRTPQVLDILKKYGVHATFFLVGNRVNLNTIPIAVRALKEGHSLGAHSMNHVHSDDLTESEFKLDTETILEKVHAIYTEARVEQNEFYYRFPFGEYGRANSKYHQFNALKYLSQSIFRSPTCINFVFWTLDSSDWLSGITPQEVYQNVVSSFEGGTITEFQKIGENKFGKVARPANRLEVTKGGVILFHDIHSPTLSALPDILDYFLAHEIQVKKLTEVDEYSYAGKNCSYNNLRENDEEPDFF